MKNRKTERHSAEWRIQQILHTLYTDEIKHGCVAAISASLLADKLEMRPGTHFNKILREAVVKGYITATKNSHSDRRFYRLTETGRKAISPETRDRIRFWYGGDE